MEKKEYIERGKLIDDIKRVYCAGCDNWNEVKCRACKIDDAMLQIDSAPAADVVEVVRCKGCVWWEACRRFGTIGKCERPHNGLWNEYTYAGDYCSYGKRKEE